MLGHFVALRKAARLCHVRQLAVGVAAVALCVQAAAAADKAPPQPYGTDTWGGLSWGIGIATDFDIGGSRVANASVVNNIVRVTDSSSNVGISFVLEAHYFFRDWIVPSVANACASKNGSPYNCTDVATGPFVAIEVGDGSSATPAAGGPITAYAMGWMVGFRHPNLTSSNTSSWNFGVGLRVDPKAQVLGDGLIANQPLPAGDSIRYKTEPRAGIMLLSSFSF
jgi:hypothetical protein